MDKLLSALAATINTRAFPLLVLAPIKYPGRELQPQTLPDGMISITLAKWGFQYKSRKMPRPSHLPPVDTEGIRQTLNSALAPPFVVREVIDQQKYITIIWEEIS